MLKLACSLAAVLALASPAAPAFAQSPVTFVSGKGTDAGTCATPESPCRTFQYAHGLTSAGGEIKTLDPANYFFVTITKSISIIGVDGAGIIRGTAGDAITINAGASGVVTLSNLTLDGFKRTATTGIVLNSAASLTIRNCAVRNFFVAGIHLLPSTALNFLITDTVASDNGYVGVQVNSIYAGSARGVLDHVAATKNVIGVSITGKVIGYVDVTAVDSVASDNIVRGFSVSGGTTLRLSHSTATRNDVGVLANGTARSAGNNFINGNTSVDVAGALTNDGTQ